MTSKRWQILFGVLAILAISLACSISRTPADLPRPVSTSTPAPKLSKAVPSPIPSPRLETVSALRALNVRESSSFKSAAIGVLYHGESVRFTGECRGHWAKIRFESGSAWVNSRYVTGNICKETE